MGPLAEELVYRTGMLLALTSALATLSGLALWLHGEPTYWSLAIGLSGVTVGRIERGLARRASILHVAQLLETVGLELSARAFPGGPSIRDAAQVAVSIGREARGARLRLLDDRLYFLYAIDGRGMRRQPVRHAFVVARVFDARERRQHPRHPGRIPSAP